MNVLFIPSWYPHPTSPTDGIFQRDQALAIGELRPNWNVAVSLWGQGDLALPMSVPGRWPGALRRAVPSAGQERVQLAPNVVEYRRPLVTWSHRLLSGRAKHILDANRANLRDAVRDIGPIDVIHAHVAFPAGWVAQRLSQELRIPFVVTEHMAPFPFPSFVRRDGALDELVRGPLEAAHARIAVSAALADEMARFEIHDVNVVPNLVDESFFAPVDRKPNERFTLFALGRLESRKGFADLLEAAARVDGDLELRIGGTGPERRNLARLASARGLDDKVVWLGPLAREAVREELHGCDGFALASRHESFGIVYAEALACGRPVLATRSGGPEEIVTEGDGILVDVGSTGRLAEAIRAMRSSIDSFDSAAIRQRFLERFSRPVVVAAVEAVYDAVQARG